VPSHRDRKSFHPAFAAVPPPKPGGFSKPVPPVLSLPSSLSLLFHPSPPRLCVDVRVVCVHFLFLGFSLRQSAEGDHTRTFYYVPT
jgi:hypothetical protein